MTRNLAATAPDQDKESTKRTILLRVGALIRQKELKRVRRKFVMMPE